jgi:sugar (pentulose or hexulose) kinase
MLDALVEIASTEVDEVRLVGGGARNSRWNRIHANVLGRPLSLLQVADVGMVGAAMCAAVAVGAYADFQAAADAFVRIEDTVEPDSAHVDDYSALSDRYRSTFDLLNADTVITGSSRAPEHA